ncbi:HAMP domain-containing sensor histidine kinase [Streptacidiphilus sp. P02-A3a]|uniref:sensor histidine kinase n=1 Tax=Streptacidiphilus sp. P02-A3a TaxID=2704468 RepID=UPI0015F89050|nr:HAMP domain-containing sensor histidine kinase [Streptacidiphilus sp. P02-A3a]QMU72237.1 HAMP domain-containing histidine kinase [Streptacidiphilus sp. P02-A3a]
MRNRLLGILLALMACVLLALGLPLAVSVAAAEQQQTLVDRIDDTARFADLAQDPIGQSGTPTAEEQLRTLQSEIQRYYQVYGGRVGVFELSGRPITAQPGSWTDAAAGGSASAFSQALDDRRSTNPAQVWPWQSGRLLVVASPVVWDGDVVAVVVTESPTGGLGSRILHRWMLLAGGEAAAVLVAVVAAVTLTAWVLRPVQDLDKVTHDIATGRLASRVAPAGGPPELRRLARAFNEMADHVEQVLDQQRAFVADASHQLRNPLAALMLRVEAMGMELPEGSEQELAGVRVEGRRLAQVLDDLLGLAVAEHTGPRGEPTDLARLAADRADGWRPLGRERGVELRCEPPAAPALGLVDPVGFGSALDAVIDNALKFSPAGGEVTVAVTATAERIAVAVSDTGPGLTEEEAERIGDRFWRSPRHQNVDGSGLGLSIARTLLAAGGGTLAFGPRAPGGSADPDSGGGTGLTVTLSVPRA